MRNPVIRQTTDGRTTAVIPAAAERSWDATTART
jgi:hypothetical protein